MTSGKRGLVKINQINKPCVCNVHYKYFGSHCLMHIPEHRIKRVNTVDLTVPAMKTEVTKQTQGSQQDKAKYQDQLSAKFQDIFRLHTHCKWDVFASLLNNTVIIYCLQGYRTVSINDIQVVTTCSCVGYLHSCHSCPMQTVTTAA